MNPFIKGLLIAISINLMICWGAYEAVAAALRHCH